MVATLVQILIISIGAVCSWNMARIALIKIANQGTLISAIWAVVAASLSCLVLLILGTLLAMSLSELYHQVQTKWQNAKSKNQQ